MGGSKQSTKPSPENQYATGAALGYVLGPGDFGSKQANAGGSLFGAGPGSAVGILPAYSSLQDLAGQSFFGGLAGPNANPMLTQAYNTAMTPGSVNVNVGGIGGGMGGGMGGGAGGASGFGPNLIPGSAVASSVNKLQNPPSVFDTMSGGPIVDTINQKTAAASQAYTDQQFYKLSQALEISVANDAGQGFLSASTIDLNKARITEGVMHDISTMDANLSLEGTKYLGDLAMQDIINGTNAAQNLIQDALMEKGINADYAAKIAVAKSEQATQLAIAQLSSQTQLAMNTQDTAAKVLGLGAQDFATTQQNQMNVANLPLGVLTGLASNSPISKQNTKSL